MTERRVTQCVGHTKKGHGPRCKRRTSRTNLCWTHLASEQHLKIKPSQIAGGGLGLYTLEKRKKGKVVAPYTGRTFSKPDNRWGGEYAIQLTPDRAGPPFKYVDANRSTDGAGRYANAARRRDRKQPNSKLSADRRNGMAKVIATKTIPEGREVYAMYGRDYWGNR